MDSGTFKIVQVVVGVGFVLFAMVYGIDTETLRIIQIGAGISLILYAVSSMYKNYAKTKNWIKVTGRVLDIIWHEEIMNAGNTVRLGKEVVTFNVSSPTNAREQCQATSTNATHKPSQKGKKVAIFYDPQDKKKILVYNTYEMYLRYMFVIIMGTAMVYFAIIN